MPNSFNKYPYTDFHELNLDWIINAMKKLEIEFDEFKVVNNITFSGQWDITKQYPAWTIVNDNNIGYVSIKPVPVGVVLTNTNYWAEVIDYSAQIAGMQNRIVALENEDIVINGKINTINTTLDNITDREIILLGDSYGVDASAGGTSWATIVETALSDRNIYRNTIGGTGFASDAYISDNNLSMIQALTIPNADKIKDIVILGGANDANLLSMGTISESTLKSRIRDFMTYCKTTFPNAKVKLAFVGWRSDSASPLLRYIRVATIYQDICNEYENAAYYSDGEVIMHNISLINSLDFIHPTQAASDELGLFAISMINNGTYQIVKKYTVNNPTMNTGWSINGNLYGDVIWNRNTVEFAALGDKSGLFIDIRPATPPTITNGQSSFSQIVRIPNFIFGINRNHGYTLVNAILGTSQGAKDAQALIVNNDGYLGISFFNINANNGATISNALIPPFTLNYPIRLN